MKRAPTLDPIELDPAIRELVDGELVFIPNKAQRDIMRRTRDQSGKRAALELYHRLRDHELPDELTRTDPQRIKELMLRSRDGRGYARVSATLHLRHLVRRRTPTVEEYRARARRLEALRRHAEAQRGEVAERDPGAGRISSPADLEVAA